MKAIALISGGLDSILAARIIKEEGIDVIPLNFKIPFCQRKKKNAPGIDINSFVKSSLGQELKTVEAGAEFLKLVLNPRHGFGSNMNPCIDCKIFMLTKTKELMRNWGAEFVVTGEVLGQRPMSQHRRALEIIEEESGLRGLLLRPLCAGVITETLPEQKGWVKRERLFKFSGRTRRPQMALAREFNISNYPNAAGGCLLTDANFSGRLRDLIEHQALNIENAELLKIGRHFRLGDKTKLIVGRDAEENQELEKLAAFGDYLFMPNEDLAGPTCLGRGEFNAALIRLSTEITCSYSDLNGEKRGRIIYYKKDEALAGKSPCSVEVTPLDEKRLVGLRL